MELEILKNKDDVVSGLHIGHEGAVCAGRPRQYIPLLLDRGGAEERKAPPSAMCARPMQYPALAVFQRTRHSSGFALLSRSGVSRKRRPTARPLIRTDMRQYFTAAAVVNDLLSAAPRLSLVC
jgi:hypothetical protein